MLPLLTHYLIPMPLRVRVALTSVEKKRVESYKVVKVQQPQCLSN